MIKEMIADLRCHNALPSDIEMITDAFLCHRRNFFTSQRFPQDIENKLHALLLGALLSPDLQLKIAFARNKEPVFFAICAPPDHPVAVHLAGVWPEGKIRNGRKRWMLRGLRSLPSGETVKAPSVRSYTLHPLTLQYRTSHCHLPADRYCRSG